MSNRTQIYELRDLRSLRAALRRKREAETGRWFFAVAGVNDSQLMATGVFTGDHAAGFFAKQSIKSLKGKLLALRDRHMPGKRFDKVTIVPHGETSGIVLPIDSLVSDFETHVLFRKKTLYHACLYVETPEAHSEEME